MEVDQYHLTESDGVWSCGDLGITVGEWLGLLKREEAKPYLDTLVCFLRQPDNAASCTQVALQYGQSPAYFNAKITQFSRWVQGTLGRFKVVGADGKDVYWCMSMQKGWQSQEGFVWQLRDNLVMALRAYLMEDLVNAFRSRGLAGMQDEVYKWELVNCTAGADNLTIVKAVKGKNIIDTARVNPVLERLWQTDPKGFESCLDHLFDESKPLDDRIAAYKTEMRALAPSDWKICANDERTAGALLMCRYPQKYTVYKDEVYQLICST